MNIKKILPVLVLYLAVFITAPAHASPPSCNSLPLSPAGQICTCGDQSVNPDMASVFMCCQGNARNSAASGPGLPGIFYWTNDCVTSLVLAASTNYLGTAAGLLKNTILIVLSIAIVGFGYKIMTNPGDRRNKKDAFELMFKMVAIWGLLYGFGINTIVQGLIALGTDLGSIIASSTVSNAAGGSAQNYNIWMLADRLLTGVMGVAGNVASLSFGTMAIIVAAVLFSGPIGVGLVLLILTTVTTLAITLISVVYLQLAAVIAIVFLAGFAPIFLPCMLFKEKGVHGLYEKWLKLFTIYSLQPVMLVACLSLIVVVLAPIIGFNLADPYGPPLAKSLLSMIQGNNLVGTCNNFQILGYAIPVPCVNLGFNFVQFGILLVEVLIVSLAMYKFLKAFPDLVERIIGGGTKTPQIAKGMEPINKLGNYAQNTGAHITHSAGHVARGE